MTVQCTLEHRLGRLGTQLPSPSNLRQPLRARTPSLLSILCFNSFSAFLCNRYCSPRYSLHATQLCKKKGGGTSPTMSLSFTLRLVRSSSLHQHPIFIVYQAQQSYDQRTAANIAARCRFHPFCLSRRPNQTVSTSRPRSSFEIRVVTGSLWLRYLRQFLRRPPPLQCHILPTPTRMRRRNPTSSASTCSEITVGRRGAQATEALLPP